MYMQPKISNLCKKIPDFWQNIYLHTFTNVKKKKEIGPLATHSFTNSTPGYEDREKFICDHCSSIFMTEDALRNHIEVKIVF